MPDTKRSWWRQPLILILMIVIGSRLVLTGLGIYARTSMTPSGDTEAVHSPTGHLSLDVWAVYDTRWYTYIADHGYPRTPHPTDDVGAHVFAFFPLYPWLMAAAGLLLGSSYLGGLAVSIVCLTIALWLLYHLIKTRFGSRIAWRSVVFLLLLPGGMVLTGTYSESLFLMLMIASFWFAQRRQWWLMGIAGGLAALTRSLGVALILPLGLEFWFAHRQAKTHLLRDGLALLLIPLGLVAFMYLNYTHTGDAQFFVTAQGLPPWNRHLVNPLATLIAGLRAPYSVWSIWAWTAAATLATVLLSWRRRTWTWTLTGILLVVIPLATGLLSMIRLTTVVWPAALGLALISRSRWAWITLVILLAVLQGWLMTQWTNAYYLMM